MYDIVVSYLPLELVDDVIAFSKEKVHLVDSKFENDNGFESD